MPSNYRLLVSQSDGLHANYLGGIQTQRMKYMLKTKTAQRFKATGRTCEDVGAESDLTFGKIALILSQKLATIGKIK